MNWKELAASVIDSLAWPLVVVVSFFVFKERLGAVLSKIAKVKYKDFELDFEQFREQAKEVKIQQKKSIPKKPDKADTTLQSLEEQILNSLDSAPSASILLAWSTIETALASAVSRMAISPESPAYRSPLHNIEALQKYSNLSSSEASLLHEMRMLRNKISHEHQSMPGISSAQAEEYTSAAFDLVSTLNSLKRKVITLDGIREGIVIALNSSSHAMLLDALSDTDPGHYGVDDAEYDIDLSNIRVGVSDHSFEFKDADLSFSARLGSSREEDGVDINFRKVVSGNGKFKILDNSELEVTEFQINGRIDLFEEE